MSKKKIKIKIITYLIGKKKGVKKQNDKKKKKRGIVVGGVRPKRMKESLYEKIKTYFFSQKKRKNMALAFKIGDPQHKTLVGQKKKKKKNYKK